MVAQEQNNMEPPLTGRTMGSDWDVESAIIMDAPEKHEIIAFGTLNKLPYIPARTRRGDWKEGGKKVEMADFQSGRKSLGPGRVTSTVSLSSDYGSVYGGHEI
jgi:hypothetical protein